MVDNFKNNKYIDKQIMYILFYKKKKTTFVNKRVPIMILNDTFY